MHRPPSRPRKEAHRRSRRARTDPWTTTIFARHPGIYAPYLRARESLAERELVGLRRILTRAGIDPPDRILDIACGLGRHIVRLGTAGFQVVGCDLSPAFLREARQHARRLGLSSRAARFYCVDYARVARKLQERGERPFDAVLCLFTSMGYRGRRGDLHVLRSLHRIVRPGGLFIWETGDRDWVLRHFEPEGVLRPDASHELHERRTYRPRRTEVRSVWTFYRRDRRGRRRRLLEIPIRVRLQSVRDLADVARASGWIVRNVYGDLPTLRRRTRTTRRLVLVAQRPTAGPAPRRNAPIRAGPRDRFLAGSRSSRTGAQRDRSAE